MERPGEDIAAMHFTRHIVTFDADELASYNAKMEELTAIRAERIQHSRRMKNVAPGRDTIDELVKANKFKPGSRFEEAVLISTYQAGAPMINIPTHVVEDQYTDALVLLQKLKEDGGVAGRYRKEPHDTPEKVLSHLLHGSPVFRFLVLEIHRILDHPPLDKKDKVMILFYVPKVAHCFFTIAAFMGVPCALLTSRQTPKERSDIIKDFNETDEVKVLIATYEIQLAGFDCHLRCAQVICAEPAMSASQEAQALMCVHRAGQQMVTRIHQKCSFMDGLHAELVKHGMEYPSEEIGEGN
ncbi:hypothetical protein BDY17DRAFT_301537 [Neohortaea acidophila]|uniref:Helicase C-terminal domain-containing protein n=1 Tax=Neohortaea acidophila TaxID=245834 RepID=A0A6A6PQ46_9PEZI|nr:uncharacterized protein BDY17DRAFT_301537 [Neohortaea acidophila]KAF2481563.1 hypothetical protein BDY17DRAFT_301537 [Neohortaea acidophila]